jgi:hypothetical protein
VSSDPYLVDSATGLSTALTPQVDDLGDTPPAWSADGRWPDGALALAIGEPGARGLRP